MSNTMSVDDDMVIACSAAVRSVIKCSTGEAGKVSEQSVIKCSTRGG